MKLPILTGLALFTITGLSHAQTTIGTYDFTANSLAAVDANGSDGITLSALNTHSFGDLFDNGNLNGAGTVSGFLRLSGNDTQNGIATVLTNSLYLSFTVTNNSGATLNLAALSFDYQRRNTFEMDYAVFSDAQGFDSVTNDAIASYAGSISGTDSSLISTSISLTSGFEGANVSAADFQIANGASREFIIAVKQNSTSNTRAFDIDNISLSYTAAIPEPSAAALLGGLVALTFALRRGRQRRE